jgi:hypothetical protein
MFSFLTGVMCWPVLILYRITSSSSRKYIYSAIWILACAASVLLFLHNYRIKETPSFGEFEGLWDIVTSFFHYWFAYIGAIFVYPKIPSVFPAIYIGIAALSVLAVFAWQVISKGKLIDTDVMEVYRTFFAISLFSLLSGALIALGRMKTLDIAPIHPLFGIYIPFSLLFWASLFVIAWLYFWDNHLSEIRLAKYAAVVASICIGVFYLKSYGEAASIPPPVTPQTNDCFKAWPETGVIDCFSHVLHDRSYERSGAILQKMKEHSIIY